MATMAASMCFAQDIQVNIDGQAMAFSDAYPRTMRDNVFVPARQIFEHMGGDVHWDGATRTATAKVDGRDLSLKVGDFEAMVDGRMQYLQNAPEIVNGRLMIPIGFLGSALNAKVDWSETDRLVSINTNGTSASYNNPSSTTYSNASTSTDLVNLHQDQVIPATLDQSLSTTDSQVGDTFTVTINRYDEDANLPNGTKLEGHVADVQPATEGQPPTLDLVFDRLVLPDGRSMAIDGSLNEPMDYLENQAPDGQQNPDEVMLSAGTELSVRINQDATMAL